VGTRDLRKLSGYGRAYPVIAVFGTIAAASMAGLPPTMGFVAKEAVYGTLLDHGSKLAIVALIGIVLGSVLTVAYSARFVWGAFASKPGVEPCLRTASDGPLFTIAPAALTVLTVGGAFAAGGIDRIVTAWSSTLPVDPAASAEHPYHVALWHGFEPALLLSLITIVLGLTMFAFRTQVSQFQVAMPDGIDFHGTYRAIIAGLEKLAAVVTARTQRGSMPFYQGVIYVVAVVTLGITLLMNDVWPVEFVWLDSAAQLFPATIMVMAAIMLTRMTKRFAAVVVSGLTGYAMVIFFAIQGAPDLALTQILVETITIVVFVFVLRRLPARIGRGDSRLNPALRAVIAILFAVVMMVVTVVVLGARQHLPISVHFPRLAYEGGHGENIVNVTLVDIRAWDTMGELAVVIACAIGVASLIFVTGQGDRITPLSTLKRDRRSRRTPVTETVRPRSMGTVQSPEPLAAAAPPRSEQTAIESSAEDKRAAWLLAGRTLAPHNRSIVLEVAVRLLFHAFLVFSIYLLFAGHNAPGGGFAAGLVAGIAFIARYLAGGRYEFAEAVRLPSGLLMGIGMLMAAGTAVAGFLWGEAALQSFYLSTDVPVLGYVSFGSSTIFDVGVYLIVVGLVVGIIRSLAVEVDLQLVEDEDRIANELPGEVDRSEYDRIHELLGRSDRLDVDGTSAGGHL
jgi:multicomponent Na+:H+ antiporter subunit A